MVGTAFKKPGRGLTEQAFVVWDGHKHASVHTVRELMFIQEKQQARAKEGTAPPIVHAPEISDLQYVTRLDPDTDTPYMERSNEYRGRSAPLPTIDSAEMIYELFRYMGELDSEHIVVGLLNVRNELIGWKIVHAGELAAVEASGRQIVRDALLCNAAGLFILHNHPTGDPAPSEADKDLTKYLVKLSEDLDIGFFDHVIIGCEADHHEPFFSFREEGLV